MDVFIFIPQDGSTSNYMSWKDFIKGTPKSVGLVYFTLLVKCLNFRQSCKAVNDGSHSRAHKTLEELQNWCKRIPLINHKPKKSLFSLSKIFLTLTVLLWFYLQSQFRCAFKCCIIYISLFIKRKTSLLYSMWSVLAVFLSVVLIGAQQFFIFYLSFLFSFYSSSSDI